MAGTCDERCRLLQMPAPHAIADLRVSPFVLSGDQTFPGYPPVILRDHATELFHLTPAMRAAHLEQVPPPERARELVRAIRDALR